MGTRCTGCCATPFRRANYHRGKELHAVYARRRMRVQAHFPDGEASQVDLLVGADGIRSTVRQQYLPDVAPLYAGYTAWRGLMPKTRFPPALAPRLFEFMSFCLPPGEQMLGYPVAGPDNDLRPGHRRYNVVWYRPAERGREAAMAAHRRSRQHACDLDPAAADPREAIAEMRAGAERLLAPQFRAMVRLIAESRSCSRSTISMSPRMAFGRVAIVGDAAFVARPHVGAGVSKAADDAAALAEALRQHDDVESALKRFEAARLPRESPHHRARAPSRRVPAGDQ